MAEYFSSARMESGRIIKVGDKMRVRLNLVKDMIRAGSLGTILKKIWRMERATFYDLTTIRDHYPLSWALVHFFKNTRNPYYARPWKRWMDEQTKRNLKTVDQLYEETLGKIDLDRLQKDLTAYVQKGL